MPPPHPRSSRTVPLHRPTARGQEKIHNPPQPLSGQLPPTAIASVNRILRPSARAKEIGRKGREASGSAEVLLLPPPRHSPSLSLSPNTHRQETDVDGNHHHHRLSVSNTRGTFKTWSSQPSCLRPTSVTRGGETAIEIGTTLVQGRTATLANPYQPQQTNLAIYLHHGKDTKREWVPNAGTAKGACAQATNPDKQSGFYRGLGHIFAQDRPRDRPTAERKSKKKQPENRGQQTTRCNGACRTTTASLNSDSAVRGKAKNRRREGRELHAHAAHFFIGTGYRSEPAPAPPAMLSHDPQPIPSNTEPIASLRPPPPSPKPWSPLEQERPSLPSHLLRYPLNAMLKNTTGR